MFNFIHTKRTIASTELQKNGLELHVVGNKQLPMSDLHSFTKCEVILCCWMMDEIWLLKFFTGLSIMMMMIVKDAIKQIWKTILSSALLFNFCNTIFDNFQWFLVLTNIWCLNVYHHHHNSWKCINCPLISSSAFLPLIQAWHRNNASRNIVIIGFVAVFTIL